MNIQETDRLIRKIKKGDTSAFEKLVYANMERSYRLAFRLLGNNDDANDAVQDSWIKIWQNIHSFRKKAGFKTWMYRIITNTCLDYLKKRKKRTEPFTMVHQEMIWEAGHAMDPETLFITREQIDQLKQIIDNLPPKQRSVFILRDLEGLSPEEVCTVLHMEKDVVKSHLYHARKSIHLKVKKRITKEERYYDLRKN